MTSSANEIIEEFVNTLALPSDCKIEQDIDQSTKLSKGRKVRQYSFTTGNSQRTKEVNNTDLAVIQELIALPLGHLLVGGDLHDLVWLLQKGDPRSVSWLGHPHRMLWFRFHLLQISEHLSWAAFDVYLLTLP